jgi:hypothetical protein
MHAILPRFVLGFPRKSLASGLHCPLGSYAINSGHGFAESLGVDPFIIGESLNPHTAGMSRTLRVDHPPPLESELHWIRLQSLLEEQLLTAIAIWS